MNTLLPLILSLAVAGAEGELAYLAGANPATRQVCAVDVESGEVRELGPGRGDGPPAWAPDGEWLAFESEDEDGVGIYVVRADGSDGVMLDTEASHNHHPQWAPDGERIAYSAGEGLRRQIRVHDRATGEETVWAGGQEGLLTVRWMSDDELLATALKGTAGQNLSSDLFRVTEDTAELIPLGEDTEGRYFEWAPAPNPANPGLIAFESNDGGFRDIFIASEERGLVNVSNHRRADWNPAWSPDGEWLVFESFREGRRGIFRVYPETMRVHEVAVSETYENWAPAWAPEGERVAFVSNRDGAPRIFVIGVEGGDARPVTEADQPATHPAWRPGSSQ
ncbi:MAG: TolB family protein [Candidatus Hydrogenedentota bacterium]